MTMKIAPRFLVVFVVLFALVSPPEALAGSGPCCGSVPVSGYTRSNGTYVAPYVRRAPGTASASHAFTATGGRTVAVCLASQETRDGSNVVVKESSLPRGFSTAADRAKAIARQPPLYGWSGNEISRPPIGSSRAHYSSTIEPLRDSKGRIRRSTTVKRAIMRRSGYSSNG